jgi:outer membrane protein assembly factor BamE (lipoprotein component of BamABCDE complex)
MPSNEQAKAPLNRPIATIRPARKTLMTALASGLLAASIFACAPVVDNRGYVFNENLLPQIQKGTTKADTLIEVFGSPSTVSTLNGGAFYYISSKVVTESYRAPEEVERKVLAIYFDRNKAVRDFAVYGLEDGIIIPIVARTTRAQGQELSFIEQIFTNLGRFGDAAPGSEF